LVRVERILKRELVQAELGLELAQVALARGLDADSDEVAGACGPFAAVVDRNVRYLAAGAIGRRADHSTH
jgi:hypothetical protein